MFWNALVIDSQAMTMDEAKWKKLQSKGWRQGTAADFLALTPEEEIYINLSMAPDVASKCW